ncbi:MAG: hypothetical protein LLG04_12285 [Parachlamydia sp.]|nr:hypothetical protein [Parachlamydia sp.]
MQPIQAPLSAHAGTSAGVTQQKKSVIITIAQKIFEQRYTLLVAAGIAVGVAAIATGQLPLLSLTVMLIAFGVWGIGSRLIAKNKLQQAEEELAKTKRAFADFTTQLPSANTRLETIQEIGAFGDQIISAATKYKIKMVEMKSLAHFVGIFSMKLDFFIGLRKSLNHEGQNLEPVMRHARERSLKILSELQDKAREIVDLQAKIVESRSKKARA